MAIGNFLGGAAEGIESAETAAINRRQQDRLDARFASDERLRERAQATLAQQNADARSRAVVAQGENLIAEHSKVISNTIDAGMKRGMSPQQINHLVEPLIADVESVAKSIGKDPSIFRNRLDASLGLVGKGQQTTEFAGTGMAQQSANILMQMARKREQGIPLTAEDRRAYTLAYDEVTAPKVVGSASTGFQVTQKTLDPSIFPAPDSLDTPREPQIGQEVSPFGAELESPSQSAPRPQSGPARVQTLTAPSKPQTAERAGRGTLVSEGAKNALDVKSAIVNPDGSVNRDTIFSMVSDIPLLGRGIPGTEGRGVRAKLEDALASKLRLETGAQANQQEIQNILDRFMPSLLDDDKTVKDKMDRLERFFMESLRKTEPELAKSLIGRARIEGKIPEPPSDEKGSVFKGFDPSSGVAVFERKDGTFFGIQGGPDD